MFPEDAIYIARRKIELARALKQGAVTLVALDWKKAFDSIHVESMIDALRRLGMPQEFTQMVEALMKQRFFTVNDNGCSSAPRPQMSGISQGCTLSPLLFVLLMTVLLHDAVAMLPEDARRAYKDGVISDCVYADDTLLIGTSDEYLNSFLLAVATAGRRYGCELHWQKFQVLAVGSSGKILSPAGEPLKHVKYLEYLGACLTADGDMSHELGRKIGEAKRTFTSLRRLWSHSALTWRRKLNIYAAVVESKLLYGLSSACFTKAQLRRLDGFQNRCVRQIIGVKPLNKAQRTLPWPSSKKQLLAKKNAHGAP